MSIPIRNGSNPNGDISDEDTARRTKTVGRLLWLAAVLASVAVIPYTYSIVNQQAQQRPATATIADLASNALIESLISYCFIGLGLRLRNSLGLGLTLLAEWPPVDEQCRRRVRNSIALAVILGLGSGVILGVLDHFIEPILPKPRRPLSAPPAWAGLLASVGAGIQEEIWLRLGIMTTLVWLGTRITRRASAGTGIVWTANLLAAMLFGAIHIPQALAFVGPGALVLAYTLLANGVPGMVFGWLYWRHGLVAAMICHFAADFVLKFALPLAGLD
jgi:Type II CAAX prenyl endopeptidase Rce1-like